MTRAYLARDPYWKRPTVMCSHCKYMRPLDAFWKSSKLSHGVSAWCVRCVTAWRAEHRSKILKSYREKMGVKANRDRRNEAQRRKYRTDPAILEKARKYARKNRKQIAAYRKRRCHQPRVRLMAIVSYLARTHTVKFNRKSAIRYWLKRKDYLEAFEAWRAAGFGKELAPRLISESGRGVLKGRSYKNLKLITTGRIEKSRWARYHELRIKSRCDIVSQNASI